MHTTDRAERTNRVVIPPSILMFWPVIKPAFLLQKNSTMSVMVPDTIKKILKKY